MMRRHCFLWTTIGLLCHTVAFSQSYKIVGTGVTTCYDNTTTITCPDSGASFYGQFPGSALPSYRNNGDGTVTDLNTGLTWQSSPDENGNNNGTIEKADKLTWTQIQARIITLNAANYAGHNDWRIPAIKELYSLTNWNGTDPSGYSGTNTSGLTPFLNQTYFPFAWGQTGSGERLIDVQYASSNLYNELDLSGAQKLFGFNFADGRIKGYGLMMPGGGDKVFSFIAVRGNSAYGINHFIDNHDLTITDTATGLMWAKDDSQIPMNWEDALAWVQARNAANYCGHNDWRLPNAKELQSIVDYTRSPGSTNSAAIDPIFNCTSITNEAGFLDWPWFWTGTTHRSFDGTAYHGGWAVYICFGRAAGWQKLGSHSYYSYCDVHGAGAQRSSPKSGTYLGDYFGVDSLGHAVYGLGPQGDVLRVNNFVRLVRDAGNTPSGEGTIEGKLFQDSNRNSVIDSGEVGIPGWKVYLGGLRQDSTQTGSDGRYSFFALESGSYTLRLGVLAPWAQTVPMMAETTVAINDAGSSVVNFGVYSSVSTMIVHVSKGWNIISMPESVAGVLCAAAFPSANSPPYYYSGSYVESDTMRPGTGYWLKFPSDLDVSIDGQPAAHDTIELVEGWNLIGAIGYPVSVSGITSNTDGLLASKFYGYEHGYTAVKTLLAGKGYWVKANQAGSIFLSNGVLSYGAKTLPIMMADDFPPSPPAEEEIPGTDIPNNYSLAQNYPNPFNPETEFTYTLPDGSSVRLSIYNTLGQEVALLINGEQSAGNKDVRWNAGHYASGLYFYRLDATSERDPSRRFSQTRKLMLTK